MDYKWCFLFCGLLGRYRFFMISSAHLKVMLLYPQKVLSNESFCSYLSALFFGVFFNCFSNNANY